MHSPTMHSPNNAQPEHASANESGGGGVSDDRSKLQRSYALDPVALSARVARHFIRDLLREGGREQWTERAELAVTEVVTNAVLHAHTPFTVTATLTADSLHVEVRDENAALPTQRRYDVQATTGRGMDLVAAVTTDSGVRGLGAEGKVVWFRVADEEPEAADVDPLAGWADLDDLAAPAPAAVRVQLLGMPPILWLAARQHHDAVLREFALHLAEHGPPPGMTIDLARADEARVVISAAFDRQLATDVAAGRATRLLPEWHPSPLPDLPPIIDVEPLVMSGQAGAFAALQDALDEAERLAASDALLVRPALPEVTALRDWACEQVIAQLHGSPPAAWVGAADDRFTTVVPSERVAASVPWDDGVVRRSDRGVVAADDANRIVAISQPLAAALGWRSDSLVGRRVVTLIPKHLRETHVAGFTRHLTTGEAHVLGVPLKLPVLRADGSTVTCRFLIERAIVADRSVYLAWVDVLDEDG